MIFIFSPPDLGSGLNLSSIFNYGCGGYFFKKRMDVFAEKSGISEIRVFAYRYPAALSEMLDVFYDCTGMIQGANALFSGQGGQTDEIEWAVLKSLICNFKRLGSGQWIGL